MLCRKPSVPRVFMRGGQRLPKRQAPSAKAPLPAAGSPTPPRASVVQRTMWLGRHARRGLFCPADAPLLADGARRPDAAAAVVGAAIVAPGWPSLRCVLPCTSQRRFDASMAAIAALREAPACTYAPLWRVALECVAGARGVGGVWRCGLRVAHGSALEAVQAPATRVRFSQLAVCTTLEVLRCGNAPAAIRARAALKLSAYCHPTADGAAGGPEVFGALLDAAGAMWLSALRAVAGVLVRHQARLPSAAPLAFPPLKLLRCLVEGGAGPAVMLRALEGLPPHTSPSTGVDGVVAALRDVVRGSVSSSSWAAQTHMIEAEGRVGPEEALVMFKLAVRIAVAAADRHQLEIHLRFALAASRRVWAEDLCSTQCGAFWGHLTDTVVAAWRDSPPPQQQQQQQQKPTPQLVADLFVPLLAAQCSSRGIRAHREALSRLLLALLRHCPQDGNVALDWAERYISFGHADEQLLTQHHISALLACFTQAFLVSKARAPQWGSLLLKAWAHLHARAAPPPATRGEAPALTPALAFPLGLDSDATPPLASLPTLLEAAAASPQQWDALLSLVDALGPAKWFGDCPRQFAWVLRHFLELLPSLSRDCEIAVLCFLVRQLSSPRFTCEALELQEDVFTLLFSRAGQLAVTNNRSGEFRVSALLEALATLPSQPALARLPPHLSRHWRIVLRAVAEVDCLRLSAAWAVDFCRAGAPISLVAEHVQVGTGSASSSSLTELLRLSLSALLPAVTSSVLQSQHLAAACVRLLTQSCTVGVRWRIDELGVIMEFLDAAEALWRDSSHLSTPAARSDQVATEVLISMRVPPGGSGHASIRRLLHFRSGAPIGAKSQSSDVVAVAPAPNGLTFPPTQQPKQRAAPTDAFDSVVRRLETLMLCINQLEGASCQQPSTVVSAAAALPVPGAASVTVREDGFFPLANAAPSFSTAVSTGEWRAAVQLLPCFLDELAMRIVDELAAPQPAPSDAAIRRDCRTIGEAIRLMVVAGRWAEASRAMALTVQSRWTQPPSARRFAIVPVLSPSVTGRFMRLLAQVDSTTDAGKSAVATSRAQATCTDLWWTAMRFLEMTTHPKVCSGSAMRREPGALAREFLSALKLCRRAGQWVSSLALYGRLSEIDPQGIKAAHLAQIVATVAESPALTVEAVLLWVACTADPGAKPALAVAAGHLPPVAHSGDSAAPQSTQSLRLTSTLLNVAAKRFCHAQGLWREALAVAATAICSGVGASGVVSRARGRPALSSWRVEARFHATAAIDTCMVCGEWRAAAAVVHATRHLGVVLGAFGRLRALEAIDRAGGAVQTSSPDWTVALKLISSGPNDIGGLTGRARAAVVASRIVARGRSWAAAVSLLANSVHVGRNDALAQGRTAMLVFDSLHEKLPPAFSLHQLVPQMRQAQLLPVSAAHGTGQRIVLDLALQVLDAGLDGVGDGCNGDLPEPGATEKASRALQQVRELLRSAVTQYPQLEADLPLTMMGAVPLLTALRHRTEPSTSGPIRALVYLHAQLLLLEAVSRDDSMERHVAATKLLDFLTDGAGKEQKCVHVSSKALALALRRLSAHAAAPPAAWDAFADALSGK